MKKAILLLLLSFGFFSLSAQSEITYKNFGEGWVISMNEDVAVDMDENGTVDFYVNRYINEMGVTPIFTVGCFASPGEFAVTSFHARKLSIFEEGGLIQLNPTNLYDYIDDGRGSGYSLSGGFAEDWSDNEDVYIGVALIMAPVGSIGGVRNGWIKVSIDSEAQELTIKEWAYTKTQQVGDDSGILAGDPGELTSVNKLNTIDDLSISPNPATDRVVLSFDYTGTEKLSVVIQNNVGQEVYRNTTTIPSGNSRLDVYTDNWTNGMYFVHFETATAVRTERLSIAK